MSTPFDTLSAARSLEASGIESKQAEAIVGAIRASVEASVTKTDLTASTNELRGEMKTMAAELRGEMNELRGEIKAMATELRGEMKTMAAELRGELGSAVNRMLLAQLAIAALLFTALRIFWIGFKIAPICLIL